MTQSGTLQTPLHAKLDHGHVGRRVAELQSLLGQGDHATDTKVRKQLHQIQDTIDSIERCKEQLIELMRKNIGCSRAEIMVRLGAERAPPARTPAAAASSSR